MPIKKRLTASPALPFDDPAEVIQRVMDAARLEGRKEGRQQTLTEMQGVLKDIIAKLEDMFEIERSAMLEKKSSIPRVRLNRTKQPLREGTDQARVLAAIKANPGMKGVDIAAAVPGIKERTLRTALHRLKAKRELIEPIDGRWYLKGEGPRTHSSAGH